MTKNISKYTLCGPTSIDNRASAIGDRVVSGNNVIVTNIKMSEIRNSIGEADNDLGALFNSIKVNKWSHFGPYEHSIVSNKVTPSLKSNKSMGEFAGYDDLAFEPYIEVDSGSITNLSYWKGESGCADNASIIINMHLAEIDFKSLAGGSGRLVANMVDDNNPNNNYSFTITDYENDSTFQTMTTERDVNSQQGFPGSIIAADYTITLESQYNGGVLAAYVGDPDSNPVTVTVTETINTPYVCVPNDNCHPSPDPQGNMLTLDTEDINIDVYSFRRHCSSTTPKQFIVNWKTVTVRDYMGQILTNYSGTVDFNIKWWPTQADEDADTNAVFHNIFSQQILSSDNGVYDWGSVQMLAFDDIDLDQRNKVVIYWSIS